MKERERRKIRLRRPLLEELNHRVLVGDGAMGTLLLQQGIPVGTCLEHLNLSQPHVVARVHELYIRAGADVLETNTFGAHRDKLAPFGLTDYVEEINKQAVTLARQAAGEERYVLGAVGSIVGSQHWVAEPDTVRAQYMEQIKALVSGPIDGLLLETFLRLDDLLLALACAKELTAMPVVCQLAVEDPTTTLDGVTTHEAIVRLLAAGADIVGFNCRVGPMGTLNAFEAARIPAGALTSAYPNAGMPEYEDGAYVYRSTPEYMAQSALRLRGRGVHLIGGCCGTSPEHIRAMATALHGLSPIQISFAGPSDPSDSTVVVDNTISIPPTETVQHVSAPAVEKAPTFTVEVTPTIDPSATIPEMARQRHTIVVELDPPRDLNHKRYLRGAKALRDAGADAITLADNSLAITRMSNMALGALIQQQLGIRPIVHMACRDRNSIGQQSHLMGLHALGIDHVLAITGDPPRLGDMPGASSVYDVSSTDLLRMIKQLNEGLSFSGRQMKQKAQFTTAAAFNPNVRHLDKEVRRLERKIQAGADFIMTQPVFDPNLIETIYDMTKHLSIPIFLGIWPLSNARNAEFLHNEMPGILIAEEVRRRMASVSDEAAPAEGVAIAKELLDVTMPLFKGIYLMTPLFRYDMTVELTQYVLAKTSRQNTGPSA